MTKKPYAAPELRSFGSVKDLTRSSVPGGRGRRRRQRRGHRGHGWCPSGSSSFSP